MAIDTNIKFSSTDMNDIFDKIYPIGSIYMSTNNINPSSLFGGEWIAWGGGRVPIGVDGVAYTEADATGGNTSHAHTMNHTHTGPSHTHTIASHAHTSAAHTHSINGHTHIAPSHIHATGDCTLSINQIPSHEHKLYAMGYNAESTSPNHWQLGFGSVGLRDNIKTVAVGGGGAHNHGATGWAGNSYTTDSGTLTTNSTTPGNTGGSGVLTTSAAGTGNTSDASVTNTGSGSNIPPYVTCYMWKRTA